MGATAQADAILTPARRHACRVWRHTTRAERADFRALWLTLAPLPPGAPGPPDRFDRGGRSVCCPFGAYLLLLGLDRTFDPNPRPDEIEVATRLYWRVVGPQVAALGAAARRDDPDEGLLLDLEEEVADFMGAWDRGDLPESAFLAYLDELDATH